MSPASRLNPKSIRKGIKAEQAPLLSSFQSILNKQEEKIQELKDLVEKISRGKYMWESTFDAITDPVMIVSEDYKIQRANLAAANKAQMDVRKMIGTQCYESLAGFTSPCRGCPLSNTLKVQKSHSQTLDRFFKTEREYHVHAYPLYRDATRREVVLHYRDVTDERELQSQLVHSEKMAAIGTLAGGVAHEINNPLGGILAFVQLVMRDLGSDHPCHHDLKEIEESALRCKRIVQDLLEFSRQNRDDTLGPVQLNEVLKKNLLLVSVQANANRIEIIQNLAPSLPLIRGNFHKLQQVFLNLITNAYQAMDKGGRLTLKTYADSDLNRVVAQVIDTGTGIPEEHLDKIFDPYFTTKKQGEGTGLGLAITYGIVQEYLGRIDIKSQKGKGTTFSLSFPVVSQSDEMKTR